LAILIADAPGHGRQYHTLRDAYPDGDPHGYVIEDQMVEFASKNIIFAAVKIDSDTEIMFRKMDQAYKK
jgi:hypothetical protein